MLVSICHCTKIFADKNGDLYLHVEMIWLRVPMLLLRLYHDIDLRVALASYGMSSG
jgi:hypothetical protein